MTLKHYLLAVAVACLSIVGPVWAAEISTGHRSEQAMAGGTLVSLEDANSRAITPAKRNALDKLLGVAVLEGGSLVEIYEPTDTVRVATSGVAKALVTAFDGQIETGDSLSVGSLSGIASVADTQTYVIGTALETFDGSGPAVIGTIGDWGMTIEGVPSDTSIGLIDVQVGVKANPALDRGLVDGIGAYFADRGVSPLRQILAVMIFIVAVILSGTLLYGSTKGGIISLGRNPLSSHKIYAGLFEVSAITISLLAICLLALFLLLK